MSARINEQNERIRQIIGLIDLTDLSNDCDEAAIERLCEQTSTPMGNVAAVCLWPRFIKIAKRCLGACSTIRIATVVNFPSGDEPTDSCVATIDKAILEGATEIDYVMPYRELLADNIDSVEVALKEIRRCVPAGIHLKVILETGALESAQNIHLASTIAINHGADFIKTSSGKVNVNATPAAASVMLDVILAMNTNVGFKPAGGIRTLTDAEQYLQLAEDKLGDEWVGVDRFRFGASGLLQDALKIAGVA